MSPVHILLLGAGKSATTLIQYLHSIAEKEKWQVTLADKDLTTVQEKLLPYPLVTAAQIDIHNPEQRQSILAKASLVISLLPPPCRK